MPKTSKRLSSNILRSLAILVLCTGLPLAAVAEEPTVPENAEATTPMEFEKHYLVLLVRPDEPADVEPEEAQKIQTAHLAHLYKLWVDGDALIAGPFEVSAEEKMRGMVLYRGDLELDEVRALAEADPAVKANRLRVEVLPWWHGKDFMQFKPPPAPPAPPATE